jgi:hypothetical protein
MKKAILIAICVVFLTGAVAPWKTAVCFAGHVSYINYANVFRNIAANPIALAQAYLGMLFLIAIDDLSYSSDMISSMMESSDYKSSDLPDWDFNLTAQISREGLDYKYLASGAKHEGDYNTLRIGVNASRDRLLLLNEIRFETFSGTNAFNGVDSQSSGVLLMPGYKLLTQLENGFDLALFALLDFSYVDHKNAAGQWRISPGAALSAGRMTPIGLFQAGYSFSSSRNYNNDNDVTGNEIINIHTASIDYTLPLAKILYASAGVSHVFAHDAPDGLEDQFTEAKVGLGITPGASNNWILKVGYFHSIDGNNNRGFNCKVGFFW